MSKIVINRDQYFVSDSDSIIESLSGLSDINLTGLSDENILIFNQSSGFWEVADINAVIDVDFIVQDDGVTINSDTGTLNFTGAGVVVTDSGGGVTEVAIESAVESVNGEVGVVVLDADDIDDTATTNKFITATELSKLANIEDLADVTDETNVVSALNGATLGDIGTPASDDKILIQDTDDSGNLKYVSYSEFSSSISNIEDLDNVIITTPSNGQGLKYLDGDWINDEIGAGGVSFGDTPPAAPAVGEQWFNTTTGAVYVYYEDADSSQWIQSNGSGQTAALVGDSAPANPESGSLWYNSSNGNLYVYYQDADSGQWVQV